MRDNLHEINNEVLLDERNIFITCNGWELELTLEESKQIMNFIINNFNNE